MIMLVNDKELYPQDTNLQNELEISERTLRRYLENIYKLFSHIVLIEKVKKDDVNRRIDVYRCSNKDQDNIHILKYFANNTSDITWVMQLALENNPTLLENLSKTEQNSIKSTINQDTDTIEFVTRPFEKFSIEQQSIFNALKFAVKNHEYKNIAYKYEELEELLDVKCLKILFISNNWYLAIEAKNNIHRLLRISFIQEISYSKKSNYQKSVLNKYNQYYRKIQNPFTQYNVKAQIAILQVSHSRAKYFKSNMKKFFPSQRYIDEDKDGNIKISIEYTQPIEILPFIKQWLPHITIIEPEYLKIELKKELTEAIHDLD